MWEDIKIALKEMPKEIYRKAPLLFWSIIVFLVWVILALIFWFL